MKISRTMIDQQVRYIRGLYVFFNFECSSYNFDDIGNLLFSLLQKTYAFTISLFLCALL